MMPTLKETPVEPAVSTTSIYRQKHLFQTCSTTRWPLWNGSPAQGHVIHKYRRNLKNNFDKLLSFYLESLKNHCTGKK